MIWIIFVLNLMLFLFWVAPFIIDLGFVMLVRSESWMRQCPTLVLPLTLAVVRGKTWPGQSQARCLPQCQCQAMPVTLKLRWSVGLRLVMTHWWLTTWLPQVEWATGSSYGQKHLMVRSEIEMRFTRMDNLDENHTRNFLKSVQLLL